VKYDPITGRTTEYTQDDAKNDVNALHTMLDSDHRDIMDDERDRLVAFIDGAPFPPFSPAQQEYIFQAIRDVLHEATLEMRTRGIRSSDLL